MLERDGYLCQLQYGGCTTQATTADHTLPKAKGGEDTMDNLVAACRTCNGKKQDKVLVRADYRSSRWFAR